MIYPGKYRFFVSMPGLYFLTKEKRKLFRVFSFYLRNTAGPIKLLNNPINTGRLRFVIYTKTSTNHSRRVTPSWMVVQLMIKGFYQRRIPIFLRNKINGFFCIFHSFIPLIISSVMTVRLIFGGIPSLMISNGGGVGFGTKALFSII